MQTFQSGRSVKTLDRAPTTDSLPMVTPGATKTSAAIQVPCPMVMGMGMSGRAESSKSCVAPQR